MSETVIIPHNNGPYEVTGTFKIMTEGGRVIEVKSKDAWLCRCGQSAKKPFCDGTHRKVKFQSQLDPVEPPATPAT